MNSKERQNLVESYSREHGLALQAQTPERKAHGHSNEPAVLLGMMLKCAACFAVVVLLVVIGNGDKAGTSKDVHGNATTRATVAKTSGAAVERKEVFDARRARFEGNDSIPGERFAAAAATPDPAKSKGSADATCSGGVDGGMDANGNDCGKEAAVAER